MRVLISIAWFQELSGLFVAIDKSRIVLGTSAIDVLVSGNFTFVVE